MKDESAKHGTLIAISQFLSILAWFSCLSHCHYSAKSNVIFLAGFYGSCSWSLLEEVLTPIFFLCSNLKKKQSLSSSKYYQVFVLNKENGQFCLLVFFHKNQVPQFIIKMVRVSYQINFWHFREKTTKYKQVKQSRNID